MLARISRTVAASSCWAADLRQCAGMSPEHGLSESVLSGYLSLSSSAPHLFGDRLDEFSGEVRALLANRSAEGTFWDWPGDTEVVMGRKPG